MAASFGWDLGGANIKLAQAEDDRVVAVHQISCPLVAEPNYSQAAAFKEIWKSDGAVVSQMFKHFYH